MRDYLIEKLTDQGISNTRVILHESEHGRRSRSWRMGAQLKEAAAGYFNPLCIDPGILSLE
jgi:hypothetical protein